MPDQPKIALVIAGGTIGMSYSEREGGYAPALGAQDMFRWIDQARLNCSIGWSTGATNPVPLHHQNDYRPHPDTPQTCGGRLRRHSGHLWHGRYGRDSISCGPALGLSATVDIHGAMIPSDHIGTDAILNLNQPFWRPSKSPGVWEPSFACKISSSLPQRSVR